VGELEENRLREMYMLTCEYKTETRLEVLGMALWIGFIWLIMGFIGGIL